MLKFAVISIGEGSATRCLRCAPDHSPTYHAAEEILLASSRACASWTAGIPGPNLALHGPDLFEHPQFTGLLTGLSRIEAERVCVTTSGLGDADPAAARLLAESGVTHIHLVLLANSAEAHDALTAQPGSFDRVMGRAGAYSNRCLELGQSPLLCGNIPVCRHNLEMVPATVAVLASHGVRAITLDTSDAPQTGAARSWIDAALDTGMVSGAWVCESTESTGCSHVGLFGKPPVSLIEETCA